MGIPWQPRRLNELGFVGRGKSRHRPRNDAKLYGGQYPFIQTADVMSADPYITDFSQTYSEFGFQQSKLWPANTLCITIAGANTARTAILKFDACFPDSVVGFIPDEDKADLHFVKYSLDLMRQTFLSVSRGATQDNLSLDKLLSFSISTPALKEQRRIARILSAYDDLIENSQRRVKRLGTMARTLYNEWFVHFRFPGHETSSREPSLLGEIPQGWEVRKITDFADFVRGLEPGSGRYHQEPRGDRVRFLRVGDLSKRESDIFIDEGLARGKILRPDDIAITLDGSVGEVRIGLQGAYSSGIRRVALKDTSRLSWSFIYHLLLSDRSQAIIQAHAHGTTIKHAGSAVPALLFVLPPATLVRKFEAITSPMLHEILCLYQTIENLRSTRDLLLPKLLSRQPNFQNLAPHCLASNSNGGL